MNITFRGKPPGDRVWDGKCSKCDSQATAVESELTGITTDFRPPCDRHSWEKCPVCGAGDPKTGNHGGMLFHPRAPS